IITSSGTTASIIASGWAAFGAQVLATAVGWCGGRDGSIVAGGPGGIPVAGARVPAGRRGRRRVGCSGGVLLLGGDPRPLRTGGGARPGGRRAWAGGGDR